MRIIRVIRVIGTIRIIRITLVGCAIAALIGLAASSAALAGSFGLADTYFPSYGQATHTEQTWEKLGLEGSVYDGVSAPGSVRLDTSFFSLSVSPTVSTPWGTGNYEWLSIWIDWDLSRTWEENERVVSLQDQWLELGTHTLDFDVMVPDFAVAGETWMRTRITADGPSGGGGDISPSGNAMTGEVEDYRLQLIGPGPVVPEPASILLLACGLCAGCGFMALRSRGRRGV